VTTFRSPRIAGARNGRNTGVGDDSNAARARDHAGITAIATPAGSSTRQRGCVHVLDAYGMHVDIAERFLVRDGEIHEIEATLGPPR
jgi:hypothetical protein